MRKCKVGYPSVTITPIGDALAGIPYDMVQTYDAATGQWISYNGSSRDLIVMEIGKRYWVHVTLDQLWEVYYYPNSQFFIRHIEN